jgi:outer membrane receptor protein involved in Fe transport
LKPAKDLVVLPSLRLDFYQAIGRVTLDPRLTVRYSLFEGTVLKGGVGFFQQPPTPDQSVPELGNPALLAQRSTHTSLGFEQHILDGLDLQAEGFYKWLDRLVVRNPESFSNPSAPPYLNGGTGRIYGIEVLLKARIGELFQGWLAYTFQRSWRKSSPGSAERPFDFDQPHILTVLGTFQIGAGWSAGFRFRVVSGNPATPVQGSIYDTGSGTFVPVYGATNSDRQSTFHQLDLRVDKVWTFERWRLDLYLDVQNVYNQGNQEGVSYSYDYRQRTAQTGLPILPLLGVKGEW